MTTLKVADMHCGKCVERITKALNQEQLTFEVSLEEKEVRIDGDEHCVARARETLDDLGFESDIK